MSGAAVRTVVTGLGVAAPNGCGTDTYWASARKGISGIGRISRFDPAQYPARLAGRSTTSSPRTICRGGCCHRPTG